MVTPVMKGPSTGGVAVVLSAFAGNVELPEGIAIKVDTPNLRVPLTPDERMQIVQRFNPMTRKDLLQPVRSGGVRTKRKKLRLFIAGAIAGWSFTGFAGTGIPMLDLGLVASTLTYAGAASAAYAVTRAVDTITGFGAYSAGVFSGSVAIAAVGWEGFNWRRAVWRAIGGDAPRIPNTLMLQYGDTSFGPGLAP